MTAVAEVSVENKVSTSPSCSCDADVKACQALASLLRACMHACMHASSGMNVLPPDDELGRRLVHGQLQKKALRSAKDKIKDVILSKNCNPIIVRLAVGAPIHACSLGFHGRPSAFLGCHADARRGSRYYQLCLF